MADTDPKLGGVFISTKQIYEFFNRLEREVQDVKFELREMRTKLASFEERLQDHEKRIRDLEVWKYGLPASLILSFGTVIATLAEHLFT